MERDLKLIRAILIAIENERFDGGPVNIDLGEEWDADVIQYHIHLLNDALFIETMDYTTFAGPDLRPTRMTWEGTEFLEAARDDDRWTSVLGKIGRAGRGVTLDIIQEMLKAQMRGDAGLGD